jgi:purine-binding chemotaxis protein CheW
MGDVLMHLSSREVLTFRLGNESYAVDILKVQEIRGVDRVTQIPNVPEFIRGVIDLRGVIVPIVDMRMKFNLPSAEYNQFTVVIILNVIDRVVGIVVDAVADVITLTDEQIRPAPEVDAHGDAQFIDGLARVDDQMFILLDMERLMASSEMQLVQTEAASAAV